MKQRSPRRASQQKDEHQVAGGAVNVAVTDIDASKDESSGRPIDGNKMQDFDAGSPVVLSSSAQFTASKQESSYTALDQSMSASVRD